MFRNSNRDSNTVVAFFAGTGLNYTSKKVAAVDETPYIKDPYSDYSFENLTDSLDIDLDKKKSTDPEFQLNRNIYGYDGCHTHGGGVFAYGIDEPCDDLYNEIKAKVRQNPNTPITMVLIAHSRGCLSALKFAMKINHDPDLKDKLKIALDLRDPVPGNLQISVNADIANLTAATQFYDLTSLDCIKSADISIYLEGYFNNVGFNVLVSKFHANTKLSIEFLPCRHDSQQNLTYEDKVDKNNILIRDHGIYLLGYFKSLQILFENGAAINYEDVRKKIQDQISNSLDPHPYRDKLDLSGDWNANNFLSWLKETQIQIYRFLLNKLKNPGKLPHVTRDLHFDGKFSAGNHSDTNCVNMRHAYLEFQSKSIETTGHSPDHPVPMFYYSGNRRDLHLVTAITREDTIFREPYEKVMLLLSTEIKSNLIDPRNPPHKYIDLIKEKLQLIAKDPSLSCLEKKVQLESYILEIYPHVKANEGWFPSRLRKGLEWIMNSDSLLGIHQRYGIHYSDEENPTTVRYLSAQLLKKMNDDRYKNIIKNNYGKLYQLGLKFLLEFEYIQIKTMRQSDVANLKKGITDLLNDIDPQQCSEQQIINRFKQHLFDIYLTIRKSEEGKTFTYFRENNQWANFIEKFLRDELMITVPHRYHSKTKGEFDSIQQQLKGSHNVPALHQESLGK